jgi:uncharacterized protein (TIGR00369 family)
VSAQARPAHGADVIREFIANSPFAVKLGIEPSVLEDDHAELVMSFDPGLATFGDLVHGGAVASLLDTAAMAAAWCTPDYPENLRGTTVGFHVDFIAAARGADLVADARVTRRGGSLCFVAVDVSAGEKLVAKALVTYKLG